MEERAERARALAAAVRTEALELGFDLVGIAGTEPSAHLSFYERWLAEGRHGEMAYLARPDAVARRGDLRGTMPTVRSVVVVAMAYLAGADAGERHTRGADPGADSDTDRATGIIARYARGRDYHRVLEARLRALLERVARRADRPVTGFPYVDTGPLLERELAQRAGLGWFGKNTMLIHPRRGSWFFLGALLLDVELEPDAPFTTDHCGSCARCLDACPTNALLGRDAAGAPVMDARRCISYLTIENRGPIPVEFRPAIGNRIYGCDICQEVCPFNVRFAEEAAEPGFAARGPGERPAGVEALPGEDAFAGTPSGVAPRYPGTEAPSLVELMRMTRADWQAFSRGSAIRRAGYAGFKRNVAVALGNWMAAVDQPPEEALAVLRDALRDEEPIVREHAAWALERAGRIQAKDGP